MNAPTPALPVLTQQTLVLLHDEARKNQISVMELAIQRHGADFVPRLAAHLKLAYASASDLIALCPDLNVITFEACLRHECAALRDDSGALWIAFADPFDSNFQEWLGAHFSEPLRLILTSSADLTACLARIEESQQMMVNALGEVKGDVDADKSEDISARRISGDASPVVKLVNSTLYDALKQNASDIHLESSQSGMLIKYRVDGVLTRIGSVQGSELAEQAISRLKVMAELDISERRVPQDGRFKVRAADREIDFRVSIMPSIHGEDAVLRILDKEHLTQEMNALSLNALGFDEKTCEQLRVMACEPYGMLLVTGPTGSGKTTSLYATISETNHGLDKIITIEDPVEYQLPGVLQIPVNDKKGLTFARGLRSILRHDPDKIMVGEIRDAETAEIAVQAALTGHLVFTTVHANNVFDVIGRFMHMGLDPYNLVAALNVIVAQRLLRVNCPHCTVPDSPSAELLAVSGITSPERYDFRLGKGCGQCRGSGYKGRRAIAEILILDDGLRELITQRAPLRVLKESAVARGFTSLREAGLACVARGETTLQELNRVTFVG